MASLSTNIMRRILLQQRRPVAAAAAAPLRSATTTTTTTARRAISSTTARLATVDDDTKTARRPLAQEKKDELRDAMMKELRELGVGELEGAEFKIEPMRRVGEDDKTMRARLVYQSRKRGTLESDLLLSTFADENLPTMSREEMAQYDVFLDENDWDIYYWATQDEVAPPSTTSSSNSSSSSSSSPIPPKPDASAGEKGEIAAAAEGQDIQTRQPGQGEWAQTVGTFKPAYRPVPQRWKDSEILARLRRHVRARSGEGNGGMAFMPRLKV